MSDEVKDSTGVPANPEAAAEEAAVGEGQVAGEAPSTEQPEPYFEYGYLDGDKASFQTKDELAKAWRESYMRQSDYTRKTQALSKREKELEEQQKKWEDERRRQEDLARKYVEWDDRLRQNPTLYRELEQRMKAGIDPRDAVESSRQYADEAAQKLAERIESLEKRLEQENQDKQLENLHGELSKKYPDYDRSRIEEGLEKLGNGDPGPLLETLYWASRGQQSPVEMEKRLAESQKQKKAAALSPPGTNGTSASSPKTLAEARNMAMREYAGEDFDE